jgi:hypothetical protein
MMGSDRKIAIGRRAIVLLGSVSNMAGAESYATQREIKSLFRCIYTLELILMKMPLNIMAFAVVLAYWKHEWWLVDATHHKWLIESILISPKRCV